MKIYNTAPLFSLREKEANLKLTKLLESKFGHCVLLPERDGFDVAFAHDFENALCLIKEASGADFDVGVAIRKCVFLLDMGILVPETDACVVCLDEPVDEGCVCEMVLARALGKIVVGWRTDSRSPHGRREDPLRGMNFIPALMVNVFLSWDVSPSTDVLAEVIHAALELEATKRAASVTRMQQAVGRWSPYEEQARRLYEGVSIPLSRKDYPLIATNYSKLFKDELFEGVFATLI